MPSITVKNIPDELFQRIKSNAKAHSRSINNEIIYTLKESLYPRHLNPERFIAHAKSLQHELNLPPLTEKFLREAKSAGRK